MRCDDGDDDDDGWLKFLQYDDDEKLSWFILKIIHHCGYNSNHIHVQGHLHDE